MSLISQKSHARRFWLGLIIIVVIGGLIRLRGYNFAIPYIDQSDEPGLATQVLNARGLYAQVEQPGYPPGALVLHAASELLVEGVMHQPAILVVGYSIGALRAFAVLTGTATLLIMGFIGRRLGGDLGGWLAAAAWAVIPIVVYHSQVALAEPWLLFFSALALYWALLGLQVEWSGWFVLSILAGLLAVIFKYTAFPVLAVGVCAALWKLRTRRAVLLRVWALQGVCIAATAIFLFTVNGASQLPKTLKEANYLSKGGPLRLLDVQTATEWFRQAASNIGLPILLWAVIVVIGLVLVRAKREKLPGWIIFGVFTLGMTWAVELWTAPDNGSGPRYLLIGDIGFVVLFAAALALIAEKLGQSARRPWLQVPLIAVAGLIWLSPQTVETVQAVNEQALPDTRTSLAMWSLNAMDPGTVLVNRANERTFNHEWGGYTGPYRVYVVADLVDRPMSAWITDHISYVIMDQTEWQKIVKNGTRDSSGESYKDQLLVMKQFPLANSVAWRGPSFDVLHVGKMQVATNVQFGGQIALTGYDRSAVQASPGDMMALSFYWQAAARPATNYSVFIHLTRLTDQTVLAQADGAPASAARPTVSWDDPGETLIGQPFSLQIPSDLPAGQYRVLIGLYDYNTGQRLTTASGDDSYQLMTLTVQPPDAASAIF